MDATRPGNSPNPLGRLNSRQLEALNGWAMASPVIFLLLIFLIIPFVMAFVWSFTNQRLFSPNPTEYVGTKNYTDLLTLRTFTLEPSIDETTGEFLRDENGKLVYPRLREFTRNNPDYPQLNGLREWQSIQRGDNRVYLLASDPIFMQALLNIVIFTVFVVPAQGGIALILALLLNQKLAGINIFRSIYFMPVVVSLVVVSLLWRFLYDGQNGLINTLLDYISFGNFQPRDWLGDKNTALYAIIVMSVWQGVGFHMVIWLAGLQSIPTSLYEAASVEGANNWQQFRYITWPGLRNTAVFVLVVITMQAFGLFTQINAMTRGGPLDSTQTLVFQAVQRGYEKQDIAGGSAISVLLFLIVLCVSLVQRYLTRERA
jgi:multiple sugar transport system permease protein